MSDYIDRQAAIEALRGITIISASSLDGVRKYADEMLARIEAMPSTDVEPVVRCKYCHFFEADHWETVSEVPLIVAHNICTRWGGGCQTAEDGFCFMAIRSQGTREDGEQDDRA